MTQLAAKNKYLLLSSLGFLGLNFLWSFFYISIGKENFYGGLEQTKNYNFSIGNFIDDSKHLSADYIKVNKKKDIFLTLRIYADKQYDYDQNLYLFEGNVKALINGGSLKSDLLRYEKSSGILSATGNVIYSKGGQYIRAKEFKFNLLKEEGMIEDANGVLEIKNVLEDFKIDSNSEKLVVNNRSIHRLNNKGKNTYNDGIEFSFGNIQLPQNKITRLNKSVGSINNWRFKSDLITIKDNVWKANKIDFTNDPYDPNQISFEGIDVIAEEDDTGELIITSSKTNLILEGRNKTFLGKRIFGKRKRKNKYKLMYDGKDRDGLLLIRRSDNTLINNNIKVNFQPQFLVNRALLGKTNSYENSKSNDNKDINTLDLFGLSMKVNANYKDWSFDSLNDLSTLNTSRIASSYRNSSTLSKYYKMPIIDYSSLNIFTTYRSRAWNGSIGETEIKSAYGGFIEKNTSFQSGEVRNNLNFRVGTAKYEAEKLRSSEVINLWRSSAFASLESEYEIWKSNKKNLNQNKKMLLTPVPINPELVLKTDFNSGFFKYEDGSDQTFLKFSIGPEVRLGKLESNFLDYTKLSIMPGVKIKSGSSPFKFDNAIDLRTLNISFMQQIYGPFIFDIVSNINIDNNSENYGEYYNTKLGLLWHKRAYEIGIYYHPDNEAGGLYFRINGFDFDNSV